ncbi:hypothetical protein E3N88_26002 [Mikania micrantha]|uniref:Uncharacterized protein n=1 Tax=Mikania micrantha TaxID=192012 RepID=A0A5N6N832_9ASTR|nr:hypothetical protein E3N88_26002 [Mikania micrantha]
MSEYDDSGSPSVLNLPFNQKQQRSTLKKISESGPNEYPSGECRGPNESYSANEDLNLMFWIGNRAESRAKALIPLCRTKNDLENNTKSIEICSTATRIVRNPILGFSNRNRQSNRGDSKVNEERLSEDRTPRAMNRTWTARNAQISKV